MLGIDVGRHKGRDGYGSNERIFVDRYVGGGGTKPRNGNHRYENQNKVKQKNSVAVGSVAVKPYPQQWGVDKTPMAMGSPEMNALPLSCFRSVRFGTDCDNSVT